MSENQQVPTPPPIESPSFEVVHREPFSETAPVDYIPFPSEIEKQVLGKTTEEIIRGRRADAVRGAQAVLDTIEMKNTIDRTDVDPVSGLQSPQAWDRKASEFVHRAKLSEEQGENAGLVFLAFDVDNLKMMNELGRHKAGNKYYKIVGDGLKKASRTMEEKGIFRITQGDEGAIVLWGVDSRVNGKKVSMEEAIKNISERFMGVVEQMIITRGFDPAIYGVSIGGAYYKHGDTVQTLYDRADANAIEAKIAKKASNS